MSSWVYIWYRQKPVLQVVYHASTQQGLTLLEPRVSTHGQVRVYAVRSEVVAMMFLMQTDDFVCATGEYEGTPCVVERFTGAFDHAYAGIQGSLYALPSATFVAGQKGWNGDLVSSEPVVPLSETHISDVKTHLLRYVDEGRLIVKSYPERLPDLPDDDEDLVRKAIEWQALDKIERYHPHLLSSLRAAMAAAQVDQ